ncbi:hypothetical protein FHS23_004595 [Prauserella isguenensis]|uniref:Uncharacterized protein n=1 Tax=Prauserella isguenensis TaxID=1470180 RepID=A0A839S627_9PSEU|nr:hypothetical protein [Prauserella isguenensis]MBB3053541.1 hypothetical protein [Prauserella isguenensis]
MDPQNWSAIFAGVSALGAVATAGIAGWSLLGARKDSRDRTRPVVVASLKKGPEMSLGVVYLVIENNGQSLARHLEVRFDPPLPDYTHTDDGQQGVVAPVLRKRYGTAITLLAPGHQLKNIYSYMSAGSDGNVEPVPAQFTVSVHYVDDHGRGYADSFPLDVDLIGLETQSDPSDGNNPERRKNKRDRRDTGETCQVVG